MIRGSAPDIPPGCGAPGTGRPYLIIQVSITYHASMLSIERELQTLRPLLGDRVAEVLIARERREVFSVRPEARLMAWAGAMMLATAAGIVLKNNLDRIGPVALAAMMGLAAAACYAWVWWRRDRAGILDEYILLLGALLVSADAAFIETQFRIFGDAWHRHFVILAVLHGAGAYLYRSRTLLSLSIGAVAGWLGVHGFDGALGRDGYDYALRATAAAAVVIAWRRVNRRDDFTPVFEHFAALLLLAAGVALMFEDPMRELACLVTIGIAAGVVWWGFRVQQIAFVLYGFVVGVIACNVLVVNLIGEEVFAFFFLVLLNIGAIVALIVTYARFRGRRA